MPAENRDVRGNSIYPAEVDLSRFGGKLVDASGKEHTGEIGGGGVISGAVLPSSQTVTTDTVTKLAMQEYYPDDPGWVDEANNKIVIGENGIYALSAAAFFQNSGAWTNGDNAELYISHNGGNTVRAITHHSGHTKGIHARTQTKTRRLNEGDEIEWKVRHSTGSDETVYDPTNLTHLSVFKVGE